MKQKRQAAGRADAAQASPAPTQAGTPDQHDAQDPSPNEARLRTIRTPHPDIKTRQTHRLILSDLCPASRNPLPGATLLVFYKTRKRFLDVFALSAYIKAAVEQPTVENVEDFTQAVALDCAAALGQKVYVEGRYPLRELGQEVVCIVKGHPPKGKDKTRDAKAGKARKSAAEPASGKSGKIRKDRKKEVAADKEARPPRKQEAPSAKEPREPKTPREAVSSGQSSTTATSTTGATTRAAARGRGRSAAASPQSDAPRRATAPRSRRTTSSRTAASARTTPRAASTGASAERAAA